VHGEFESLFRLGRVHADVQNPNASIDRLNALSFTTCTKKKNFTDLIPECFTSDPSIDVSPDAVHREFEALLRLGRVHADVQGLEVPAEPNQGTYSI